LTEFEKVKKLIPKGIFRARIHFRLAECYEETKRYHSAISSYEEARKTFPKVAAIYLGLGRTYFQLKRYREAIKNIKRVIELNDRENNAHFLLAKCYKNIGLTKQFNKELDKALLKSLHNCKLIHNREQYKGEGF
jgi:tetratricopeptide (TPR) repeat protein